MEGEQLVSAKLSGPRPVPIPARLQRDANVERQVFCSHYDACLDEASRNGWDDFTCRFCPVARRVTTPSAVEYANDRHEPRE